MQNDSLEQIVSVLISVINGSMSGAVLSPIIFGLIEILDGVFHFAANVKRGLALLFAFLLPAGAYGVLIVIDGAAFSGLTLLIAFATGCYLAVQIHDQLETHGYSATDPAPPATGEQTPTA